MFDSRSFTKGKAAAIGHESEMSGNLSVESAAHAHVKIRRGLQQHEASDAGLHAKEGGCWLFQKIGLNAEDKCWSRHIALVDGHAVMAIVPMATCGLVSHLIETLVAAKLVEGQPWCPHR